jgi:sugar-specific transcriptional regulator TrmB
MDKKILENLGLTGVEIEVYLTIIDLGSCLAGEITRKTGIHRRTVYDAIERLIEKGLISYIKTNNRKYFEAYPPKKLLEIIREKETLINSAIPELQKRFEFSKEKKETLFFRGKQALKTIFDDQISEGKEVLVIASTIEVNKILEYYFPKFNLQRKEKNIKMKMLFSESLKNDKIIKRIPLAEIRYLPKHNSNVSTNIYGNKISIVVWGDSPTATLIKEKAIADAYRNYFGFLWQNSAK